MPIILASNLPRYANIHPISFSHNSCIPTATQTTAAIIEKAAVIPDASLLVTCSGPDGEPELRLETGPVELPSSPTVTFVSIPPQAHCFPFQATSATYSHNLWG